MVCLFPVIMLFPPLQGEKILWLGKILEMTKLCVYKTFWKLSRKFSAVGYIILNFKLVKLRFKTVGVILGPWLVEVTHWSLGKIN